MSDPDSRYDTPLPSKIHPEHGVKCPECKTWWNNGEDAKKLCESCEDDGFAECDYCQEVVVVGSTKETPSGENDLCDDCWASVYG